MKILFLDVDGVLNSVKDFMHPPNNQKAPYIIDQKKVERLYQIINQTGCKIVLSSTWRLYHQAVEYLWNVTVLEQMKHPDWRTVDGVVESSMHQWRSSRGHEIQQWLDDHAGEYDGYVILDDDGEDIKPYHWGNFVQTTWVSGLEDGHVDLAISILGRSDPME